MLNQPPCLPASLDCSWFHGCAMLYISQLLYVNSGFLSPISTWTLQMPWCQKAPGHLQSPCWPPALRIKSMYIRSVPGSCPSTHTSCTNWCYLYSFAPEHLQPSWPPTLRIKSLYIKSLPGSCPDTHTSCTIWCYLYNFVPGHQQPSYWLPTNHHQVSLYQECPRAMSCHLYISHTI